MTTRKQLVVLSGECADAAARLAFDGTTHYRPAKGARVERCAYCDHGAWIGPRLQGLLDGDAEIADLAPDECEFVVACLCCSARKCAEMGGVLAHLGGDCGDSRRASEN